MKRLGVLTPLLPEAACLMRRPLANRTLQLAERISLYVCGLGGERARTGVERLVEGGAEALICLGTAGALEASLEAGDVLLPEGILRRGGQVAATHERWRDSVIATLSGLAIDTRGGHLLHVDEVVQTPAEKRALHSETGALAVDMESAVMVEAAARLGIPALVLRVVVDRAATGVPQAVLTYSDVYGRPHLAGLLGALLRQPQQLGAVLRIGRDYRLAARRLQRLGRELGRLQPPD